MEAECALLRSHGHSVETYTRSNDEIEGASKIRVGAGAIWSRQTVIDLKARITAFRPNIIHAHNTFPLISPSLYWAAHESNVPVVQTLHNFRLFCLQAMFLRDGQICEDCLRAIPWRGVARRCYRDSVVQSAALCGMLIFHRTIGTYDKLIARYIALSEFSQTKFIEAGIPGGKIVTKPNFVDVPRIDGAARSSALFVGRLSNEKGTDILASALSLNPELRIRCIGDGPERDKLSRISRQVELLGLVSGDQVLDWMRRSSYLVMPNISYENFPRTLVEAFACGLPVITSRLGAMAELVRNGETGLLVAPNSPRELCDAMNWANQNPHAMSDMGRRAREEYEHRYTGAANHERLMEIYQQAVYQCNR